MTVRTTTKPASYRSRKVNIMSQANGPKRSEEAAKNSQQSFSKESRNPLGMAMNPKSKAGITFASQDNLPQLPIPDLEATCNRYLDSLRPLQTPKEHHDTQVAVKEFLKSGGFELQEKLKKYATGKANYIEQFCTLSATHLPRLMQSNFVQGTTRT